MILIKPSYEIKAINGGNLLLMEEAGRNCYKSESKGNPASFLASKVKSKHLTIIEHGSMTVKFIVDRGFTHELVRHRMAVYSQESTRYCNYQSGVVFIIPPWVDLKEGEYTYDTPFLGDGSIATAQWYSNLLDDESCYQELLKEGWSPQQARTVLPNSLKTEIYMTANFREWRLVFEQRALGLTGKPHPQMEEIMLPLMNEMKKELPAIFGDLSMEGK
jgi:thymidylate synthase (FAD)